MTNETNQKQGLERWRFKIIYAILIIVFTIYTIRLFNLQVIKGEAYLEQAEENRIRNVSVQTQRGSIVDRNDYVLARNAASYNVAITPANLPADPGTTEEIYRQLSSMIDVPVTNGNVTEESARLFTACQTDFGIKEIVLIDETNTPYTPVFIKCNVDKTTAMRISEKEDDWPGVTIEVEPVRQYPTGSLTAEIIGFLGPITAENQEYYTDQGFVSGRDKVGYAGIEYSMDDVLRGTNGLRIVEVDSAGKEIRDIEEPVNPVPGNSLRLTIDTRLQAAAKTILNDEISTWNIWFNQIRSLNGVVIAMNPKTGEILALVSEPTYENNRMETIIPAYYYNQLSQDPLKPLLNHAVSAQHPPGSVFKMVAAVGALNEGVVGPEEQVACPGTISIIQKYSPNDPGTPMIYYGYDREGHGMCDFVEAVALSDDIYFYKIGGGFDPDIPDGGLGAWMIKEYAEALGYGQPTGIELPGEVRGLIPDPTWKRINKAENWSTGDTYIMTIGQGYVLATPLQVLVSFAILANDGVYMQPTLIRDILDSQGNVIKAFEPVVKWDVTKDPMIDVLDEDNKPTGEKKTIEPWVIEYAQEGMRQVVVYGTAKDAMATLDIPSAGKTGTAEYCDDVAQEKGLCQRETWPFHAWYVGYAPYDDPEIVVVAFVYNGGEGASVAAPIVKRVLDAYFEMKAMDTANQGGQ
jgi:penicillin-binding protein 2